MHNFKIDKDLIIRYKSRNYNYNDLSTVVSYWKSVISKIDDPRPILLIHLNLSISYIGLLLALIQSKREYWHSTADHLLNDASDFSTVFVIGVSNVTHSTLSAVPNSVFTDSEQHIHNIEMHDGVADLEFEFSPLQTVNFYTSGSTGAPKAIRTNSSNEYTSIVSAIQTYFKPTDRCLFFSSMRHPGVHTTAIFPALFYTRYIVLASTVEEWNAEIANVDHVQFFASMIRFGCKLPPKLRVLTTGGNPLRRVVYNFIVHNCQIENFIDIYGLTECPPPLAVRYITDPDSLNHGFTWIQPMNIPMVKDDLLYIQTPDSMIIETGDIAKFENDKLIIYGRWVPGIRVNGGILSIQEFSKRFEEQTNVVDYVVRTSKVDRVTVIDMVFLNSDKHTVEKYLVDNEVEVTNVTYQDNLDTAGGIKHVLTQ